MTRIFNALAVFGRLIYYTFPLEMLNDPLPRGAQNYILFDNVLEKMLPISENLIELFFTSAQRGSWFSQTVLQMYVN